MAVRPINAINLKKYIKGLDVSLPYDKQDKDDVIRQVCCIIDNWPTLTPPNEWVSVEDELPKLPDCDKCSMMVNTARKGNPKSFPMIYERAIVRGKRVER